MGKYYMGDTIQSASHGASLFLPEHYCSGLQLEPFSPGDIWGCQNMGYVCGGRGGMVHKKHMPGTMLKILGALGSPKEWSDSTWHVHKLWKPAPLSSSLYRWEPWGLKSKHPIQPLTRNKWLSRDSNIALHNSKTLTPPYQTFCLTPLCKIIASPIYHFTMLQSSNLDSEFLHLSWSWLTPHYLHGSFRSSSASISQMSMSLTMRIPERLPDSLLAPLLRIRLCLTKSWSLFCFYYSTSNREFPETPDGFPSFSIEWNSECPKYLPRNMRSWHCSFSASVCGVSDIP